MESIKTQVSNTEIHDVRKIIWQNRNEINNLNWATLFLDVTFLFAAIQDAIKGLMEQLSYEGQNALTAYIQT